MTANGETPPLASIDDHRPAGTVVIDMHTHAFDRSMDSGISARALVEQVARRGLDGVCLTDHNAICSPQEAAALAEEHGVAVIPGMEVGTNIGHVLVFGLDRFRPELVEIKQLRRIVTEEGGAMVWAHPMRELGLPRPNWEQLPDLFEALEVLNGDHSDGTDGYYVGLAEQLGLGLTAGSDAHSLPAIGRVGTAFDGPVDGVEALVTALHARAHRALDFRTAPQRGI